ncbi:MAG TPA: hypothetical protein VGN86_01510 [Pyrinomonadaceae bacterium]|jgi:hypothetical protein|nr:hypothetical protein [Pyrinomonadaceae bacterium]
MAGLKTLDPDVRELKRVFALMLSDRFTETNNLAGRIVVRIQNQPFAPPFVPLQQPGQPNFFFFNLPSAPYTLQVRSNSAGRIDDPIHPQVDEPPYYLSDPPYYFDADVPVVFPPAHPLWPAYPDLLAADQSKPLDDPTQPAGYRQQRAIAALQPTAAYPFPAGTTLVRGRVLAGGEPLSNARVRRIGDDLEYLTGVDGQFVLFFKKVVGPSQVITLRATHPAQPDKDQIVTIKRGMTVAQDMVMAP